ncbi:hypothetical protein Taro_053949 [Colocasia esculenta]|uniref:Metallophosphoesterase n=1 Tax=Colocasia esculenta TaxID=4460 RepID=A0A843XP97_COLES|nr:hypothetical protein [Colocasia esculenta]
MFVGIDDTMTVGLRGPANFFGHPTDERIKALELELQYWDAEPDALKTKIVFGHFPMSFTASSESGKRYESVFSTRSVSAYLCGHLHAKVSKQLWRLHTIKGAFERQFWEWELGDWKESRLMRILAIDQGDVSFLDIKLNSHGHQDDFPTTVLITYPIDSRSMSQVRPDDWVARNDINVVVFSVHPICNVTAKVYDSLRAFKAVEEIPLQLAANSFTSQPLFSAKWNAENYKSVSASRYWLQVFALDVHGKETASTLRPFSVEGKSAHLSTAWLTRLVFYVQWEKFYPVLLWSNIMFLVILLLLPKITVHFVGNNSSYRRWSTSIYVCSAAGQKRPLFWPMWFLIEGSRNKIIWFALVSYLACLLCLPWFWGYATSVDQDLATMSIRGWMITPSGCPIRKKRMGTPDVMTVTLPFMYLVVTPLFLLIYSLLAERSAFFSYPSKEANCHGEIGRDGQCAFLLTPQSTEAEVTIGTSSICRSRTRIGLLSACAIFTYIYIKHFLAIGRAYGVGPVALSPAFVWAPPLFLATTLYLSQ